MKVFVGYGYNDRDKWIEEFVFPVLESFGAEVISGSEVQGQIISEAVKNKIRNSDCIIAFLTRREQTNNGWNTHRWVSDELAAALAYNKKILEVRETGVSDQGGIAGDRQRIEYDENHRDLFLVNLVKIMGQWSKMSPVQLQLLPGEFINEIRPLIRRPGFRCTYNIMEGNNEFPPVEADVKPITGGLFVHVKDVPQNALIQLHVEGSGKSWSSDYEPVKQSRIHLREDN